MIDRAQEVLKISNLDISISMGKEKIHAIRGLDLILRKGETVALVGESGSGKSITMKAVMGILPEGSIINKGSIILKDGEKEIDILKQSPSYLRTNIVGKRIAMIFQDPMTSLNPTMTIGGQLKAAILAHAKLSKDEVFEKSVTLLREVGITEPERRLKQYPHEFSGGMRQRIVIAMALSSDPEILICDEPTTALDVTIQDKILDLIISLQQKRELSVIYITHDLGVVAKTSDYVNVMYAGRIIECGTIVDIFYDPRHPYTWGLLSAIPDVGDSHTELYSIPGTPPVLTKEPVGDAFAKRNPYALNIDFKKEAPLFKISNSHYAATWLLDERAKPVSRPKELEERIQRMRMEAAVYVNE
ncbi:oligopeptide transport system ATP-binding protein [Butyrivibrio sp. ob235]|uniref:ABC transporter ATP-binding protein n=1 Tax=Butyrivibrio sp. ob235 TaxID=1761780 RepID=UPI0008BF4C42|nr:ABC transporter ATP-binding protein [Butyrivibrio sp. ob235]SEK48585.1 oligopeptide transport system ATP-binding protein [Butyrivibrio sp. ob235]